MKWYQQKTTWTGIGGIVTAVSGFFMGTLDAASALQLGIISLIGIFLRQGVEKKNNPDIGY